VGADQGTGLFKVARCLGRIEGLPKASLDSPPRLTISPPSGICFSLKGHIASLDEPAGQPRKSLSKSPAKPVWKLQVGKRRRRFVAGENSVEVCATINA
jgi:hypothetical protein